MTSPGPSAIAALDRQAVPLYSDLLLHDMGTRWATASRKARRVRPRCGRRRCGACAGAGPLPARRARGDDLVDAAIRMHDGEAARAGLP